MSEIHEQPARNLEFSSCSFCGLEPGSWDTWSFHVCSTCLPGLREAISTAVNAYMAQRRQIAQPPHSSDSEPS